MKTIILILFLLIASCSNESYRPTFGLFDKPTYIHADNIDGNMFYIVDHLNGTNIVVSTKLHMEPEEIIAKDGNYYILETNSMEKAKKIIKNKILQP